MLYLRVYCSHQLDLLSPLRKTPPLQRIMLSSSETSIQISQCGHRSEPPIPSCSFSRPAQSLSTKTVILSTCCCLRNLSAALVFPTRYRAARFNGIKSNSRGSLNLQAKCFAVSARSNLSQARYESLMYVERYLVASSFFRIGLRLPSDTSLSCCFSRGVLKVEHVSNQVQHQVLSSLINSNSEYTIRQ